jgi:predicted nuclease of predicted toxin-antitoxin system
MKPTMSMMRCRSAPDGAIWDWAQTRGAIIITKDSDFSDRARRKGGVPVIWVRSGNLRLPVFLSSFAKRWEAALALSKGGDRVVEMR